MAIGALIYMENQLEPGHCCPIVMTSAAIPVLRRVSGINLPLDPLYVQKLATQDYDGRGLHQYLPIVDNSFLVVRTSSIEIELIHHVNIAL